ncbi:MAG TPA: molybdopterin-dependent oxidoreductase [Streptosporangiaceae bacterium]|nr:molybdopterin-dependent oxidoreductase [Streptosporangiaceae bacterium]
MVGTAVELPRGQCAGQRWIPQHYGPVPRFRPQTWDLRVNGATGSGAEYRFDWAAVSELPRCRVTADLHCVKKFTIPRIEWDGIAALTLLEAAPPAPEATHVMVWADYGYSANIRMSDFAAETTLLATGIGGEPLAPEHGYPLRLVAPHLYGWKSVKWVRAVEYLTADRRGFWEERGYHNRADPWREERYSYQEDPGQAPPL